MDEKTTNRVALIGATAFWVISPIGAVVGWCVGRLLSWW